MNKILLNIFLSNNFEKDDRKTALNFFLSIDTGKNFQYLIDNLDDLKNSDSEIILTREILGWSGQKVKTLIEKIKKSGSSASRLLIEKKELEQNKKIEKQETQDSEKFSNGKLISNISNIRQKINERSLSLFNHKIFPDDETLIKQLEIAKDKNSVILCCSDLRDVLQNIEPSAKQHNMKLDEALQIIPGIDTQSINKSINALHLYLISKNISVDLTFFGIRNLIKIVSLLGAHKEDPELIPMLKKEGLENLYINDQWNVLHKEILERYAKSLELFSSSLVLKKE
jgi:hypothetical protein